MLNYIYDGSFEGLLTAIYEAYYRRENPCKFLEDGNLQINLFEENYRVKTDNEKYKKVYTAIKEKISVKTLKDIYYVFLSDTLEDRGTLIFNYIKLGWKLGNKLDCFLSNDDVLRVQNICRKVFSECHLMLGIIRFKLIEEGIYYARIEPDNNIAGILAPHFSKRLSDQNWVIHDVKRGIAAMYNKTDWVLSAVDLPPEAEMHEKETSYQDLWKQYFKSIAIKSRINSKLQKRSMPVRYWRNLVEKE